MPLIYKFKKEKLESGDYTARPKIMIKLSTEERSLSTIALLDSGSDISIIPKKIAQGLGLSLEGKKQTIYGFQEQISTSENIIDMKFLHKNMREKLH